MFESNTYNFYSHPHLVRPRHPRVPTHSTHWTPACETRRCAVFHQTLYALDIRVCPHLLHLGHPPEKDEGVLFSPTPLYALDTRVRKHLRHLAACGEALFWKAAVLFLTVLVCGLQRPRIWASTSSLEACGAWCRRLHLLHLGHRGPQGAARRPVHLQHLGHLGAKAMTRDSNGYGV